MPYVYEHEKSKLFSEQGVDMLLKMRAQIDKLLNESGAFRSNCISISGDGWTKLAVFDYLIERGELREVTCSDTAAQDKVFTR